MEGRQKENCVFVLTEKKKKKKNVGSELTTLDHLSVKTSIILKSGFFLLNPQRCGYPGPQRGEYPGQYQS